MVLKIFMNPNKYIKTEKILGWNKKKKKEKEEEANNWPKSQVGVG